MATKKFFTIIAGRKEPVMVEQGQLNKQSGLPMNSQKVAVTVGKVLIPNYATAWGRRVSADKTKKVNSISDPHYKGEVEFLPHGADGGETIELRLLPNSKSLDKQYQESIQKLKLRDEDIYVELEQGLNNFDLATDATKASFLEHHGLMYGNESRDPSSTDYDMVMYNPQARNKSRVELLNVKNTAEGYVLDARNSTDKISILATIFNLDAKLQDEVLVELLLDKAEAYPAAFVDAIIKYKERTMVMLDDAEQAGVIELEPDGDTAFIFIAQKKNILLKGVEGKGQDRIKWMAEASLSDAKVFDAVKKADEELTKYRRIKAN